MEEQTQKHPEDEQRWTTVTTVSVKVFCRFFVSSLVEAFYKPVPAGPVGSRSIHDCSCMCACN